MKEWSLTDLDFPIDDFTMECAYDLLAVFTYKSGQYVCVSFPVYDVAPITGAASRCICSSYLMASPTLAQESRF